MSHELKQVIVTVDGINQVVDTEEWCAFIKFQENKKSPMSEDKWVEYTRALHFNMCKIMQERDHYKLLYEGSLKTRPYSNEVELEKKNKQLNQELDEQKQVYERDHLYNWETAQENESLKDDNKLLNDKIMELQSTLNKNHLYYSTNQQSKEIVALKYKVNKLKDKIHNLRTSLEKNRFIHNVERQHLLKVIGKITGQSGPLVLTEGLDGFNSSEIPSLICTPEYALIRLNKACYVPGMQEDILNKTWTYIPERPPLVIDNGQIVLQFPGVNQTFEEIIQESREEEYDIDL